MNCKQEGAQVYLCDVVPDSLLSSCEVLSERKPSQFKIIQAGLQTLHLFSENMVLTGTFFINMISSCTTSCSLLSQSVWIHCFVRKNP